MKNDPLFKFVFVAVIAALVLAFTDPTQASAPPPTDSQTMSG